MNIVNDISAGLAPALIFFSASVLHGSKKNESNFARNLRTLEVNILLLAGIFLLGVIAMHEAGNQTMPYFIGFELLSIGLGFLAWKYGRHYFEVLNKRKQRKLYR